MSPYRLIMSVVTAAVAWYLHSKRKRVDDGTQTTEDEDSSNPLEFKVALIFAMLFVVFTILTHYTLVYAGTGGLNLLSFISGFSDITPFILNLLQGTGSVAVLVITACSMQAIVSNIAVTCATRYSLPVEKALCGRGYWGDSALLLPQISVCYFSSIFSKLLSFCFFNSESLVNA